MLPRIVAASVCVGAVLIAPRQAASPRTERLAHLAALDGAIRYFHPDVAQGVVHWDSVLAGRAVSIANAPSTAAYARGIADLLAQLRDPATHVAGAERRWTASVADNALVIRPGADATLSIPQLTRLASRATAIIIDLRGGSDAPADSLLAPFTVAGSAAAPASRALRYDGFPPAQGTTSGGYRIRPHSIAGERFSGNAPVTRAVAYVVDTQSVLPPLALALRTQGRGLIVSTSTTSVAVALRAQRVDVGERVTAVIRTSDRSGIGRAGINADTVFTTTADVIPATARFVRATGIRPTLHDVAIDTTQAIQPLATPTYREWSAPMPSPGFRLVAVFRLWNTIHYFFPYKHLTRDDWNAALRVAITSVENSTDSVEFGKALAEFATHMHDSHVNVGSIAFPRGLSGTIPVPLRARFIEDELVITRLPIDSIRQRTGLRVGDVIVAVDNEPTRQRAERYSRYVVSSTPQALRNRLASMVLNGNEGSIARLTVRDSANAVRTVNVPRMLALAQQMPAKDRAGTSLFRILPGNIGYVDLDRLPQASVDSMFNALRDTRAIIFDMRGYPFGTAWTIAPRINRNAEPTPAANFRRLVVSSPDTAQTTTFRFTQPIPPRGAATPYANPTVMLIDERTISQAEHTGLFFFAANGTKFVGGPTMGANGDVTSFLLPGRVNVTFTGHDVRWADDKQLQRVGVQPDVAVAPTIAGTRAGRDEVLEAAWRMLGGTGEIPADTGTDAGTAARPPVRALPPEPLVDTWTTANQQAFRIGMDETTARTGRASGHITASGSTPMGSGILSQMIRADAYRGKRIRLSGYLRAVGVGATLSNGAALWMRVDGPTGMLAFDNTVTQGAVRSSVWTRKEIVLDVPENAGGIVLGAMLMGIGEAWIDDIALDIVGTDVALTAATPPAQPVSDTAIVNRLMRSYQSRPTAPSNLGFEQRRQ